MAHRHQRHRAAIEQAHLAALHPPVYAKGQHSGQQQDKAHHRTHGEVLLANDLLENVGRQHVEAPTNDFGNAKVGDGQCEHHKACADQTVFTAR